MCRLWIRKVEKLNYYKTKTLRLVKQIIELMIAMLSYQFTLLRHRNYIFFANTILICAIMRQN